MPEKVNGVLATIAVLLVMSGCSGRSAGNSRIGEGINVNTQSTTQPILGQLLSTQSDLAVCWLGNDSWLIRGQGRLIAFDLDLMESGDRLQKPPISADELASSLDVVFITHGHGDHFRDTTAAILAKKSRCVFVVPANCVQKAKSLGISDERLVIARPEQEFDLLGLHVRPMHAFHGHRHQAVHHSANLDDCGYLLTIAGHTLLQPGDSVLTQDHLALKDVDTLFVSPTSHNMAIQPASILISALRPRWIFPQHFHTYKTLPENDFWTIGHPDELRAAIEPDLRRHYNKLHQGDVFIVETK